MSENRIIGIIAQCTQCDFSCEDYRNSVANRQAIAHAKRTGHRVSIQTTTSRIVTGEEKGV